VRGGGGVYVAVCAYVLVYYKMKRVFGLCEHDLGAKGLMGQFRRKLLYLFVRAFNVK